MAVQIRRLQPKDCKGMLEWMHDREIAQNFHADMMNKTEKNVLEFIEQADIIPVNGKSIHYAIVDETDEYLGTISLKAINLEDKNAEYAISLRKAAQNKGVGYLATKELLDLAFNIFNLEKVYLNVLVHNEGAIHLYEKCGFVLEGEFRNHLYLRGQYQNLRWYAMLKEEYQKMKYSGGGGNSYLIISPAFRMRVQSRGGLRICVVR